MNPMETLARSTALWNRSGLEPRSDETLAQLMDRGSLEDWRALYALAGGDPELRERMARLAATVPMYLPHFWQAALRSLDAAAGEAD